jgi:hypothetical protein
MSKLILASIDVTKIEKNLLYKGKKGTYLKLSIWQNDEPDQFGNDFSIQQSTGKDDPKIFLGNGKYYVKDEPKTEGAISDPGDLPF